MRTLARLLAIAALIAPQVAFALDPGKVPPITLGTGSAGDGSAVSVTANGSTQSLGAVLGTVLGNTAAISAEVGRAKAAEGLLAPLASPVFTGTVSAPKWTLTGPGSTGDVSGMSATANGTTLTLSGILGTVQGNTSAIGSEASRATAAEALLAPKANPAFTGIASMPAINLTGSGSTGDLSAMSVTPTGGTTGQLKDLIAALAPLANPTFGGSIRAGQQNGTGGLCIGGASAAEGGACTMLAMDGLANWLRIQPSKNYNPQELNVYGAAGQGFASVAAGGNTLTRVTSSGGDPGTAFDPAWVGRLIYWGRSTYRVVSVVDSSHLTVTTPTGGAVSFSSAVTDRFHFVRTTGSGRVNTSGTAVTRISGDPFIFFISGTDFLLRINGTTYAVASVQDGSHLTLATSAGTQAGAAFDYSLNIYDQISTIRVQKTTGLDEENLTISARAVGEYELRAGVTGAGQYYPIRIKNGDNSGVPQVVADFTSAATTLGGIYGQGVLTVLPGVGANRIEMAAAPAGFYPAFRARGTDPTVGMGWDLQGSNAFTWTANSFGTTYAQLNAIGFVTPNATTPASASAACTVGQQAWDTNYEYRCVATNRWRRIAFTSDWP